VTPSTKPVTRITLAFFRDKGLRPIIVTIHGSILELRCKGLRSRETVDISAVYGMAVRSRLLKEKADRRKAKRAKK
jgi:hypothetical protein